MLPDSSVRLNKYISESGICSRREADRYIEQGNVFLNGKRATIGDQVKPGDVVKVIGQLASAITLSISLTTANACSRLAAWIKIPRG